VDALVGLDLDENEVPVVHPHHEGLDVGDLDAAGDADLGAACQEGGGDDGRREEFCVFSFRPPFLDAKLARAGGFPEPAGIPSDLPEGVRRTR